jgi:nitrilase
LTEALETTEEGIIYADLDVSEIVKCKAFADPIGHYSRPDLVWLCVDTREKKRVEVQGDLVSPETQETLVSGPFDD